MLGFTCGFINWYPTDDKIETCQHINIKNEHNWDPSKHIFNISSKEQISNVFNLSLTNQVRSQTPCDPPVTYIQDDIAIHDFNRSTVNVSIGLAQDLTVDRLIGDIRVFMTKKGYATSKNERHHLVSPELLARKWGIGSEKEKKDVENNN